MKEKIQLLEEQDASNTDRLKMEELLNFIVDLRYKFMFRKELVAED